MDASFVEGEATICGALVLALIAVKWLFSGMCSSMSDHAGL